MLTYVKVPPGTSPPSAFVISLQDSSHLSHCMGRRHVSHTVWALADVAFVATTSIFPRYLAGVGVVVVVGVVWGVACSSVPSRTLSTCLRVRQ